jgi:heterodisulfide reductase subunit B
MTWARKAYDTISEILTPGILQHYDKKTARSLTAEEFEHAERTKYIVLCCTEPFSTLNNVEVMSTLQEAPDVIPEPFRTVYSKFLSDMTDGELSVDELRQIKAAVYALINS